jgi:hypothetical protein
MRFFRPVLMIVLVAFCFSGIAMADDIHVIFDPQPPVQIISGDFGLIKQTGTSYLVSWVSCDNPAIDDATIAAQQACLLLVNETGAPITDLNLQFTVPPTVPGQPASPLVGQTLGCDSIDQFLTSNTCGGVTGTLTAGQLVSFDFSGGAPIPINSIFFFGESGVDLADAPPLTITVPTPEPGTLALMLAGLLAVCLAVFYKR